MIFAANYQKALQFILQIKAGLKIDVANGKKSINNGQISIVLQGIMTYIKYQWK